MISGAHGSPAAQSRQVAAFSFPDCTVGPGVSPDPALKALAGCTADRESGLLALTLPRRHLFCLLLLYRD